jgi:hypothetical protein
MKQRNGSWFSLFGFCLAGVLAFSLGVATIIAGITLGIGLSEPRAAAADKTQVDAPATFAGVITDSYCGAKHSASSGKTSAECVRDCLRHGAKYLLVDGDASYILTGRPAQLEKLSGERVRVQGTLQGNVLRVSSVKPAP